MNPFVTMGFKINHSSVTTQRDHHKNGLSKSPALSLHHLHIPLDGKDRTFSALSVYRDMRWKKVENWCRQKTAWMAPPLLQPAKWGWKIMVAYHRLHIFDCYLWLHSQIAYLQLIPIPEGWSGSSLLIICNPNVGDRKVNHLWNPVWEEQGASVMPQVHLQF